MIDALKNHWPEYFIEAWCLGTFMLSASAFGALFIQPAFPLLSQVRYSKYPDGTGDGHDCCPDHHIAFRKTFGCTLQSGGDTDVSSARKDQRTRLALYILFQFIGGSAGVLLAWILLGDLLSDSAVNFVVTAPGRQGAGVAFAAEVVISVLYDDYDPFHQQYSEAVATHADHRGMLCCLHSTSRWKARYPERA